MARTRITRRSMGRRSYGTFQKYYGSQRLNSYKFDVNLEINDDGTKKSKSRIKNLKSQTEFFKEIDELFKLSISETKAENKNKKFDQKIRLKFYKLYLFFQKILKDKIPSLKDTNPKKEVGNNVVLYFFLIEVYCNMFYLLKNKRI